MRLAIVGALGALTLAASWLLLSRQETAERVPAPALPALAPPPPIEDVPTPDPAQEPELPESAISLAESRAVLPGGRGCKLTGVLNDQRGRALRGVELELRPCSSAVPASSWSDVLSALSGGGSVATVRCSRDGSFAFEGVPAGGWALLARGGPDVPRAAYVFRLGEEQRAVHKMLVLPRGLRLHGHVLDPEGRPCLGAEVRVAGIDVSFRASTQTGKEGTFVVGPLLAGFYRLEAAGAENFTVASRVVRAGDGDELELCLAPAGFLCVRARDERGAPVAVRLELRGPCVRVEHGTELRLARLTPGRYSAVASTLDGRRGELPELEVAAGVAPVTLRIVVRAVGALEAVAPR